MDVMEKLVEILLQEDDLCERGECKDCFANGSCYYYRVADRLIANGITVQEWVSVKERLPQEKVNCIVHYSTLIVTMMIIWQSECVCRMVRNFGLTRHIKSHTGCRCHSCRKENDHA